MYHVQYASGCLVFEMTAGVSGALMCQKEQSGQEKDAFAVFFFEFLQRRSKVMIVRKMFKIQPKSTPTDLNSDRDHDDSDGEEGNPSTSFGIDIAHRSESGDDKDH